MTTVVRVAVSVLIFLALGLHFVTRAEASETRRIGYLTLDSAAVHEPFAAAFRNGLRENGFVEGQNTVIEWRYAAYNAAALPEFASQLISQKVEVLVADGTQAALAAQRATRTTPIVVATSGDLVRAGLVASLSRPGGNVTGLTLISPGLIGKRLALLKEMAPRTHRVAVLVNPDNPACEFQLKEAQAAAPGLALQLHPTSIKQPDDIERAISSLVGRVDAMLLTDDFMTDAHRTQIGTLAVRYRLPSICGYPMPDDKICLMWYGPDLPNMFRRSAHYVARILRGTKPADLPVEQPTKLALIVNARTASALGITIPQSLMLAADSVIR